MIVALNYLVPLVAIAFVYLSYRLKKFWPVVLAVVLFVVYGAVQPSYLPKGTVKTHTPPPFETVDTPMVDRMLKPKPPEQYDEERVKAMQEIDAKLEESIKRRQMLYRDPNSELK